MIIPLFVVSWLAELRTIPLWVANVDVSTAPRGVVVTVGPLLGVGVLGFFLFVV